MDINSARTNLRQAFDVYMEAAFRDKDIVYNERLFAGMLAFLSVNYYRDMYLPVLSNEIEVKKHWWEFWK